jgi:hypothetical protein
MKLSCLLLEVVDAGRRACPRKPGGRLYPAQKLVQKLVFRSASKMLALRALNLQGTFVVRGGLVFVKPLLNPPYLRNRTFDDH